MRRFFFAAVLAFICAAPLPSGAFPDASAGPGGVGGPGQNRFDLADADGNSALSREEFTAAFPDMRPAVFDMLDADRDGAISRAEWDSFRQAHTAGGMPGAMPGNKPESDTPPAAQPLPEQPGGQLPQRSMPPRGEKTPGTAGFSSATGNEELPLLEPPAAQPAQPGPPASAATAGPPASATTAGPPPSDAPGNAASGEFPLLEPPKP